MLKAILFDFNGVILDDEAYHYESLRRVLAEEGVSITEEVYYRDCLGFGDVECFQWGMPDAAAIKTAGGMAALIARKSVYYEALLEEETRFFPGVCAFIRQAARKFPIGVASMALRKEIIFALKKADVVDLFTVIVSAEDVKRMKPDPEVYEKALQAMNRRLSQTTRTEGIHASECLVIEDSAPGIQAARAAGMPVLALTHTVPAEQLKAANHILASLENTSVEDLESLANP